MMWQTFVRKTRNILYVAHEEQQQQAPTTVPAPAAAVDKDAAEYDAQYGLYDGVAGDEGDGTKRFYAYDPEYDDE